ncbi:hypothetical protein CYMTET_51581 [Cymbomonas tetramitiformis]|uniref:Uncharacterized protein n=1 Tax=Cymbomonas tetramitiformis TaxID=36881 RepID=A0AAE0BKS2_9CHLO|nr:hypothetical protein CYMTET_51581 [Cymbomonas tetramitiformis]
MLGASVQGTSDKLLGDTQLADADIKCEAYVKGLVRRMHASGLQLKPKLLKVQGITWEAATESQYLCPTEYAGPYAADGIEEEEDDEIVEEAQHESEQEESERVNTSDEEKPV